MSRAHTPEYFVYGEPSRAIDIGFVHVERVRDRNNIHLGKVAPHRHALMSQLTVWTSGTGTYRIEDESWDFSAPAASFVPSSVVHGFEIDDDADAIVVSMADDLLPDLKARTRLRLDMPRFYVGRRSADWANFETVVQAVLAEYRGGRVAGDAVLTSLVAAALAYLGRLDAREVHPAASPEMTLALDVRRLVDAHYRRPWTLDRFARELGTTPHLLNKAARLVYGHTVKRLVVERRLLEAKRLLLYTIRPVEDIAYETGFADPAYFSRFFRLRCGVAPVRWRELQMRR